jgi:alpha-L-fucosidase 2
MSPIPRLLSAPILGLLATASALAAASGQGAPPASSDLHLVAPIKTWDEALPLGNGLLGGLLWGKGATLRLSLDRGDLWDNRHSPRLYEPDYTWKEIAAAVKRGDQKALIRRFDSTYNTPYPTKLPGGRLEITLAKGTSLKSFDLDLSEAVATVRGAKGPVMDGFFSATRPVAVFRIHGAPPAGLKFVPSAAVKKLGYAPSTAGRDGDALWFVQNAAKGLRYADCAETRRVGDVTLLAVTVAATTDGSDPLPEARRAVRAALDDGYEKLLKPHRDHWRKFWAKSSVTVPDPPVQRHYDLVTYYLGAASRRGAPPMPLQGVWTADAGALPPWHGDYHHDLNTQMTYLHYLAADHIDEGSAFLDFMFKLLPEFRAFAKRFYESPGAAIPGVMSLDGEPMGGWIQYSYSPANGAWVAWMFYRHWLYTRNPADLKRSYQFCSEIGTCLENLLVKQDDGTLTLPLSSSPEIHNNSLRAWLKPNSNYDRFCMQALFLGLADMAKTSGKPADAAKWKNLAGSLGPMLTDKDGVLMFAKGDPFKQSHRHHSHQMGIFPFGTLNIEQGDDARRIINATLDRIDKLGTRAWTGYSFSWIASSFARAKRPEDAIRYLDIYVRAFILRNGFHVNGDQLKAGYSGFTYRPFTLEGNFLAAEAVHDMLLQSWGGTVRLFPATPWRWHDASFDGLRAEGGLKISATRKNNATVAFRITASQDGPVRLLDNFGTRPATWSRPGAVRRDGGHFIIDMKAGQTIDATLPTPEKTPPAPANVSMPLKIKKS